jgi:dimethylargininase
MTQTMHAYTRAVSPHLDACALTHFQRVPIDVARAVEQHAAYEEALLLCGCALRRLPPLPDATDGVFVEDTAVLLDGIAVITRPGAPSRVGETASVAATLAEHYDVRYLAAGRLEGGDVLRVGRTLFVGLSQRTDAAGFSALRDIATPLGFTAVQVPVGGCLHLKSAVSLAGHINRRPVLAINPGWIDGAVFGDAILCAVDPAEPWAANVLAIGGTVLLGESSPRMQARLSALGLSVEALETDELRKAEAGLTCMSLIGE